MKYVLCALLLVCAGCMPHSDLDPSLHGENVSPTPNLALEVDTSAVVSSSVEYFEGVSGYLARPDDQETYPGIIMIHEWWGLNDNIMETANQLAARGYVVLAVDLFGSVANTSDTARKQVMSFDQEAGLANMRSAITYLREQQVSSVGSLGWCFGGAQSLQAGLSNDLDATVMYYGNVVTSQDELSSLSSPLLGIFGSEDRGIPVSDVEQMNASLASLGKDASIFIYDGADHAFANPSGDWYNPEAAEDAWEKTLAFFSEHLE